MLKKSTRQSDIQREWHLIDAKDQVLGRLSTQIATMLIGKNKPYYTTHLDCGDFVVVINASKIGVTGRKLTEKKYYRHSGYPGGLKVEVMKDLLVRSPEDVIRHAVRGMVPHTKLGNSVFKKLHVFAGPDHPYAAKFVKENK